MSGIFGIIVMVICGVLIIVGIILSLLNLPGVWLIFLAYLITALISGFELIPFWLLLFMLIITLLSTFVDNVLLLVSTKYVGGSKWAVLGAFIGVIMGFVIGNLVGAIVMPFVCAVAFEMIFAKKKLKQSIKSGIGTLLGMGVSIFVKFGINVGLLVFWIYLVIR